MFEDFLIFIYTPICGHCVTLEETDYQFVAPPGAE